MPVLTAHVTPDRKQSIMTSPPLAPTPAEPSGGGAIARGVLVPVAVGLLIGTLFVSVYLAAFHDPRPHRLPVVVVGSAQAVDAVRQASHQAEDALDVRAAATPEQARTAVESHEAFGALVLGPSGPELLVAGANGPSVTAALQSAFAPAAQAGRPLAVTDVTPLVKGDSRGLSVFYAAFGVVLAGFLSGLTSMQAGAALHTGPRLISAVVFSALIGLATAALTSAFDALPAPFLVIASVVGLLGLAVGTVTATLLRCSARPAPCRPRSCCSSSATPPAPASCRRSSYPAGSNHSPSSYRSGWPCARSEAPRTSTATGSSPAA